MSESQSLTQEVNNLGKGLKEMAVKITEFSSSIRELYTKQAVNDESAAGVKTFRDDTRKDAIVYLKCILPVTKNFVRSIKEYFAYYGVLSYEEWCEKSKRISKETIAQKDHAKTLVELYEDFICVLKTREGKTKQIKETFDTSKRICNEKCKENETMARNKRTLAYILLPIPVVNLIAFPLFKSARENTKLAEASKKLSETNENVAQIVDGTLLPALEGFIKGLEIVTGFFEVVVNVLEQEQSIEQEQNMDQVYFKVMSKTAKEIICRCDAFYEVLPAVRTDFEVLPKEDTDQNAVDEWTEKTIAGVREKYTEEAFRDFLAVGMKGVAQYMPAIKPAPSEAEHEIKQPKIPTSLEHVKLEIKQPEKPTTSNE